MWSLWIWLGRGRGGRVNTTTRSYGRHHETARPNTRSKGGEGEIRDYVVLIPPKRLSRQWEVPIGGGGGGGVGVTRMLFYVMLLY